MRDLTALDGEVVLKPEAERATPATLHEYIGLFLQRDPDASHGIEGTLSLLTGSAPWFARRGGRRRKPKIDLGRRVLYGFLARAGWRREEALGGKVEEVADAVKDVDQALDEVPALTWRRLDLAHGVVYLDREKTGRPRPVPIDPDIVRALEIWRTLSPARGDDDFVFVDRTGKLIDRHEAAEAFRADLLTAGIDRVELHDTSSPLRRPVRLHDLRASMVTIGLAKGRPEEWIRRRTGHTSSALERYRRVSATCESSRWGTGSLSTRRSPSWP